MPIAADGLLIAVGPLAIADRLLWPTPIPPPFRHRLAEAVRGVLDRLDALLEASRDRRPSGQSDGVVDRRLGNVPLRERPTGPGRRDRAAIHAATILRGLEAPTAVQTDVSGQSHSAAGHFGGT
jgi:hypothetical protein